MKEFELKAGKINPDAPKEEKKVKAKTKAKHIALFDLMKIMFTDPKKYATLYDVDKERNLFMINRYFSIQYPLQAHMLNRNGIKGTHVIDFWQKIAQRNRGNRVPAWVYTKTKDNQTKVKPFKYKLKDPEVLYLLERRQWSVTDWENNLTYNRDELKKELDYISKQINIQTK